MKGHPESILDRKKEKELLIIERQKKKDIKKLEEEISHKEQALNEIDNLLADPKSYENHDKIVELSKNREEIESSLEKLYEKWINLTETE